MTYRSNQTQWSRRQLLAAAAGAAAAGPLGVQAQSGFATRAVRVVVPFAAGGAIDAMARPIADALGRELGQAVIVDNKPGAGGTVGAAMVARANADGYTLLLANVGHAAAPALYKNLPYDFTKNLDSITNVAIVPNVLLVPKSLPVSNVAELVKYMKDRKTPVS